MKKIIAHLKKEEDRALRVLHNPVANESAVRINEVIFDEVGMHRRDAELVNEALDMYCRHLLVNSSWNMLSSEERILIRAYRRTGGIPDIQDPSGLLRE